jgi:hypothetical protein
MQPCTFLRRINLLKFSLQASLATLLAWFLQFFMA